MKTVAVTGSQSGMGLSTRQLLEASGVRVVGVSNTGDAEVIADLSTDDGVDGAIARILDLCNGRLDGVFANAGVDNENAPLVFGLNFLGVVRLLNGLRPALMHSRDGRVVVNSSNSVVITPGIPAEVVDALLGGNLPLALDLISKQPKWTYQVSKVAVTRWVRKHAATAAWAGSGISMNVIGPGVVMTSLIEHDMKDPRKASAIQALPKPLGNFPGPDRIAPLVKFLLIEDSRFIVGQYIIIDGGIEAGWRADDAPRLWDIDAQGFGALLKAS